MKIGRIQISGGNCNRSTAAHSTTQQEHTLLKHNIWNVLLTFKKKFSNFLMIMNEKNEIKNAFKCAIFGFFSLTNYAL